MTTVIYILFGMVCLLTAVTVPIYLWYFGVAFIGGLQKKRRKFDADDRTRFAIILCARNERAVIGHLIDSLWAQKYPREKYDIFVVADNCTDDTAEVARQKGAFVLERFNKEQVGKGYALKWALDIIRKEHSRPYDAFCLFDADNLVDPLFLGQASAALQDGADIIEGYRYSKNPLVNWVSGGHAIYWYMLIRFFHRARNNLGLSCMVSGTGFAFKSELIEPNGWQTQTMTEDCEFSIREIAKGRRIEMLDDAIFYDEQPTDFKVSILQRHRWVVGSTQCTFCCLPILHKAFWKNRKNIGALDMSLYVLMPPTATASLLSTICSVALAFISLGLWGGLVWSVTAFVTGYIGPLLVALASVWLELGAKKIRPYLPAILLYPIFLLPMAFMSPLALLRPKIKWTQIEHTDERTLEQMKSE